jgi:sec-independent protein translocase protein TatB
MFDVSFTELMVIGVVALIVIGPERLPKVARTVGHLLGRAQRYVNDVKSDIRREVELDELRKFKKEMDDAALDVKTSLHQTEASIRTGLDDAARETTQSIADLKKDVESPLSTNDPAPSWPPSDAEHTIAAPAETVTPSQPKPPTTP